MSISQWNGIRQSFRKCQRTHTDESNLVNSFPRDTVIHRLKCRTILDTVFHYVWILLICTECVVVVVADALAPNRHPRVSRMTPRHHMNHVILSPTSLRQYDCWRCLGAARHQTISNHHAYSTLTYVSFYTCQTNFVRESYGGRQPVSFFLNYGFVVSQLKFPM